MRNSGLVLSAFGSLLSKPGDRSRSYIKICDNNPLQVAAWGKRRQQQRPLNRELLSFTQQLLSLWAKTTHCEQEWPEIETKWFLVRECQLAKPKISHRGEKKAISNDIFIHPGQRFFSVIVELSVVEKNPNEIKGRKKKKRKIKLHKAQITWYVGHWPGMQMAQI